TVLGSSPFEALEPCHSWLRVASRYLPRAALIAVPCTPVVVAAQASRDASAASLLTVVCAEVRNPASFASVSAAKIANAALRAGINGAAIAMSVVVFSCRNQRKHAQPAPDRDQRGHSQTADDQDPDRLGCQPRPPSPRVIDSSELKGRPVAFTPVRA